MHPRLICLLLFALAPVSAPHAGAAVLAAQGPTTEPAAAREHSLHAPEPEGRSEVSETWRRQLVTQQDATPTRFAPAAGGLPGIERWRATLSAPGAAPLEYGLALRILDDGTTLSVGVSSGTLSCLRFGPSGVQLSSASFRWPHTTSAQAAAIDGAGHVALLLTDWTGSQLAQYDGLDGSERWRRWLTSTTSFGIGPRLALDAAGNVLVSFLRDSAGHIQKHDAASGAVAWDATLDGSSNPMAMTVDPQGNLVALVASATGTSLTRRAADDGHAVWNVDLSPGLGTRLGVDEAGNTFATLQSGAGLPPSSRVVKITADGTLGWTRTFANSLAFVAPDAAGNVIVHSRYPEAELTKLAGADGTTLWGPVATVPALVLERSAKGDVFLAGGGEVRAYAGTTGSLRWTRPADSVQALELHAGRVALLEVTGPLPRWQLRELLTSTGETTFVEPLVAADPSVGSMEAHTDPGGDVLVLASTSQGTELGTSVVKYAGSTGSVLWGPLSFARSDNVLVGRQGDLLTHTNGYLFPTTPGAVAKYAGQDGGLLWGPIGITGIHRLLEAPDHDLVVVAREATSGGMDHLTLSKLDAATGGLRWGPVTLSEDLWWSGPLLFDGAGDIVFCSVAGGTGRVSKFRGADGTRLWGPLLAPTSACEVGPAGDVFLVGPGPLRTAPAAAGWPTQVAQRRSGADGHLLWMAPLPWPSLGNLDIVTPRPDTNGRVFLLRGTQALRLDVDGRRLWGPVEFPGDAQAVGSWPSGHVALTLQIYTPGSCALSVARLDLETGGLAWGPVQVGDCGGNAALDAQGDIGVSALRDGVWHVSKLQGTTGTGLFDHAFPAGEWPIDFGGLAFLGNDVVVTGLRGLEGLTARIGSSKAAHKPVLGN